MVDLICTCECGQKIMVSEFAAGTSRQCGHCGRAFQVSEANTVSLDGPTPSRFETFAARSTADEKDLEGAQHCARCKKKFRGEWDRYSSSIGIVCHVCANLAGSEAVGPDAPRPTPLAPPPMPPKIEAPAPEPEVRKGTLLDQFDEFKETPAFRIGLYVAAFSVIGVGFYYSFFHTFPEPGARSAATETAEEPGGGWLSLLGPPEELTKDQHIGIAMLVWGLGLVFGLIPRFLAIYVTLAMADGLPGSTWWLASIHVGIMALITALIDRFICVGFLIAWYVLYNIYDLRFGDLVKFVVLNVVFRIMIVPVQMAIYGGLAWLLL